MDIEGFVRRNMDSMDEESLRNALADLILEFKGQGNIHPDGGRGYL